MAGRSERVLVRGDVVVTMDDDRRVVFDGAVAVEGNEIIAVGRSSEVSKGFKADEVISAPKSIVLPGLVCAHTHLYGVALRGASLKIKPPSDFAQILQRIWWPVDEKLGNEDAYATALAAGAELLLTGTTTFADTYSAQNHIEGSLDAIAEAVNELGVRGILSFEATERRGWEEGLRGLRENERFLQRGDKGRAMGMISLHASFTITDELIAKALELQKKTGAVVTIHASEGLIDLYHNLERYGKRTVERLRDVGLLSPKAVLAHCVHLNDRELHLLAESGAWVAHNPMSNALNAVGVARVPEMLARGVRVALGNDGYVFDMFENMRSAFIIHRLARRDPGALSPLKVLEMATVDAARAYSLHHLGALKPGNLADLIVVRPRVSSTPYTGDIYGWIVNGVSGGDVDTVVVDGEVVVRGGSLVKIRREKVEEKASKVIGKLWGRLASLSEAVEPLRPT